MEEETHVTDNVWLDDLVLVFKIQNCRFVIVLIEFYPN